MSVILSILRYFKRLVQIISIAEVQMVKIWNLQLFLISHVQLKYNNHLIV